MRTLEPAVILFSTLFIGFMIGTAIPREALEPRILEIDSYTPSFATYPDLQKGILSVFNAAGLTADREFMDAKRFYEQDDIENFRTYLEYKISKRQRYNLVLAVDDAALQFVMDERRTMFDGIPVVFVGINDERRAHEALKDPLITGVEEILSIDETIELAKKFTPNATNVTAVIDQTMTGQGEQIQFLKTAVEYPSLQFSIIDTSRSTPEELARQLQGLSDRTILIYMSMTEDATGKTYTVTEGAAFVANHAKIPVYQTAIGGMGTGILGGSQIAYEEHGKLAARQVLSILGGTPVRDIPAMTTSMQNVTLDVRVMKKFGIPERLAPKETVFINKEQSFLDRYKAVLFPAGTLMAILLAIIAMMTASIDKRKKIAASLRESEAKFRELATRDPLTGLHNRSALQAWVEANLTSAGENGETGKGALIYVDLDNFKNINDAYGHDTGDAILGILGKRLSTLEENGVRVSRIGGDEFVVAVWANAQKEKILDLLHRIHFLLEENYQFDERSFYLTASAGIAWYPEHGKTYRELLGNVDAAMYRAKAQGKDQYAFFTRDMQEEMLRKSEVQQGIRQALLTDALIVHFQPQFNLNTRHIIGYEALVRWNHPERGLLLPGEFIEAAEDGGLISRLGTRVFEQACKFSKDRQDAGLRPIKVSVNISAKQLQEILFCDMIRTRVENYGIRPQDIMLEITESALIGQIEQAKEKILVLREMGFGVCLDDFGTGFSSLSYLRELPFDILKIDKSFVTDIDDSDKQKNLTEDIIRIAHKLGMQVIAEGVERNEQSEILARLGCNSVQGFLTGKPMPPDEAIRREQQKA
jgi:diguanylate cyclase (GGDEF)-like protein